MDSILKNIFLSLMRFVVDYENIFNVIAYFFVSIAIALFFTTLYFLIKKKKGKWYLLLFLTNYLILGLFVYSVFSILYLGYEYKFQYVYYVDKDNIKENLNFYLKYPKGGDC